MEIEGDNKVVEYKNVIAHESWLEQKHLPRLTKKKIDALNSLHYFREELSPTTEKIRKLKCQLLGDMREFWDMDSIAEYHIMSYGEWLEATKSHADSISAYMFYVRKNTYPIPPEPYYTHPYIFYKATRKHPNSLVYEPPAGYFTKAAKRG